ncbi:CYTH domain-containing protein [Microbacterium sp.]|uniref:CYTH domain-containing protein n=1 Tax=Microbacterium sp. TaxID=51671 RepID=UPI003A95BA70
MSPQPSHSVEIERKYDVGDDVALPDWRALPQVAVVDAPEPRELDARYFDTADLALGRGGVAVRRREGGPDAGWHIKAAAADGKHEWHWPLDVDASPDDAADAEPAAPGGPREHEVPAVVAAALAGRAAGPFLSLARIRNHRIAYALRDAAGGLVAEVADDHVSTRNERTGREQTWREWEIELGPAGPTMPAEIAAFFAAADALVAAAGGRVAASGSKLGRAVAG